MSCVISYVDDSLQPKAQRLAEQLQLPLQKDITVINTGYALVCTPSHLELRGLNGLYQPLIIDFLSGKNQYRNQAGRVHQEMIAKACGVKAQRKPSIIDATAGLGRDAFILANLGCKLILLERDTIIAALLEDAMQRLNGTQFDLTWTLQAGSAFEYLATHQADVVYLDPMFPPRRKSALVKKDMRILADLVGHDIDSDALLPLGLQAARQRVVVKRSKHAPFLNAQVPNFNYTGRSSRFDIYLP